MLAITEGWAIVTGAGIGGFMTVIGVMLAQLFNNIHRKADFKEKIYFDSFHRRIAVYEDVLSALSKMKTSEELPLNISAMEIKVKISNYAHTLDTLVARLSLFGSPNSVKILYSFRFHTFDILDADIDIDDAACAPHVRAVLITAITNALSEFTESAGTEAPIKIVDEFVHHSGSRIKIVKKHKQTHKSAWNDNKHKKHKNH
jgi:hypothetical protein